MDPTHGTVTYLAPGAVSSSAMRFPGSEESGPWPDPDDHLVEPGTRTEMVEGEIIHVSPARPGHGDAHSRLDTVVGLCKARGYIASADLLTRRTIDSDFATDVCVRKRGQDPDTGHRHLEELAFEVFNTQSRGEARVRARILATSGVRRVFGLFVHAESFEKEEAGDVSVTVGEWSPKDDDWIIRDRDDHIDDPCLDVPLPVASLMETGNETIVDDEAARILIGKNNPVIESVKQQGMNEGRLTTLRTMALALLGQRFDSLPGWAPERIAAADAETLETWLSRVLAAGSLEDVFQQ